MKHRCIRNIFMALAVLGVVAAGTASAYAFTACTGYCQQGRCPGPVTKAMSLAPDPRLDRSARGPLN